MHASKLTVKPVKTRTAAPVPRSLSSVLGITIVPLVTDAIRQLQELVATYPNHMRICEPLRDGVEFFADALYFAITVHVSPTTGHAWFVPVAKTSASGELLYAGRPCSSPQLALRQLSSNMNVIVTIYENAVAAADVPEFPEPTAVPNDPNAPTFEI